MTLAELDLIELQESNDNEKTKHSTKYIRLEREHSS